MRSAIKLLLLAIGFFLLSCGGEGEHPLKEDYFYLEEVHKEWLAPDSTGEVFIMKDLNGISSSFLMTGNYEYLGKSWTTVMGVNTRTSYTEQYFQTYQSSFGMILGISLRANSPPHGDNLNISLGEVGFQYDFDFETVHSLDTPFGYRSLLMTDRGYEVHDDGELYSGVEFLDSLATSFASYEEVLHFTFKDFTDQWTEFTVTEIYLARGLGLVKYVMAGGFSAERRE